MSKVFIFALVAMMAVAALSAPADDYNFQPEESSLYQEDLFHPDLEYVHHEDGSVRLPRATCDLISAFGVADSACAVHCIAKRFRGGWCDKGVCHCRH